MAAWCACCAVGFIAGVLLGACPVPGGRKRKTGVKVQGRRHRQRKVVLQREMPTSWRIITVGLLLPGGVGYVYAFLALWSLHRFVGFMTCATCAERLRKHVMASLLVEGGQRQTTVYGQVVGGAAPPCQLMRRRPMEGDRGMVLRQEWLERILSGQKTVELRGQRARPGHTWLVMGNRVHGSATITRCKQVGLAEFMELRGEHRVEMESLPYTCTHALWLSNVETLPETVPFVKLSGSIGWARIRYRLPEGYRKDGLRAKLRVKPTTLKKRRQSTSRAKQPKDGKVCAVGLTNIGNTCFVNSVLQMLFHSACVRAVLHAHVAEKHCDGECILCLLWRTNEAREAGQADAGVMAKLWKPFLAKVGLAGGAQESATEFVVAVCEEAG